MCLIFTAVARRCGYACCVLGLPRHVVALVAPSWGDLEAAAKGPYEEDPPPGEGPRAAAVDCFGSMYGPESARLDMAVDVNACPRALIRQVMGRFGVTGPFPELPLMAPKDLYARQAGNVLAMSPAGAVECEKAAAEILMAMGTASKSVVEHYIRQAYFGACSWVSFYSLHRPLRVVGLS